jgi:hypothetical protein
VPLKIEQLIKSQLLDGRAQRRIVTTINCIIADVETGQTLFYIEHTELIGTGFT